MATALIPLIAAIAPEIINLITALVHKAAPAAEQTLGSGTGPVKFAQVFGDVMTALQNAAAAGQIPKALPSDDIVKVVIQAAVNSMQLSGLLGASDPTAVPAATVGGANLKGLTVSGNIQITGVLV